MVKAFRKIKWEFFQRTLWIFCKCSINKCKSCNGCGQEGSTYLTNYGMETNIYTCSECNGYGKSGFVSNLWANLMDKLGYF